MDGTQLDFPDDSFDVVWSCSSIEHFGRHEGATRSMREIERVLRPGGVASVITEYVLPDAHSGEPTTFDTEYFNLRCVYEYLLRPVPKLALVQSLDVTLPDYYRRRPVILPDESEAPHGGIAKPHIVLRAPTGTEITSIALFLRKAGGGPPKAPVRRFTAAAAAAAAALDSAGSIDASHD
jgi:SAM-dependent methyltransferase